MLECVYFTDYYAIPMVMRFWWEPKQAIYAHHLPISGAIVMRSNNFVARSTRDGFAISVSSSDNDGTFVGKR